MRLVHRFLRYNKFPPEQRKNIALNALMHISDGSLYFFAMSFISMQTIVPVFVQSLGGGAMAIGFLPILWTLGTSLPQIFLKNEKHIPVIKPIVMKIAFYQRLSYFIIGLVIITVFPVFVPNNQPYFVFYLFIVRCIYGQSFFSELVLSYFQNGTGTFTRQGDRNSSAYRFVSRNTKWCYHHLHSYNIPSSVQLWNIVCNLFFHFYLVIGISQ